MLPSKGYFKSIDCPFYTNNVCNRFYCHFNHPEIDGSLSSDLNKIHDRVFDELDETLYSNLNETYAIVFGEESVKDLPYYNPLYELNTTGKDITKDSVSSENVLEQSDELRTPKISKVDVLKTFAGCFVEHDTIPKDETGMQHCNLMNSSKLNKVKPEMTIQCSQYTTCNVNSNSIAKLDIQNTDSIIKEHFRLKNMLLQSQSKQDKCELNETQTCKDDKALVVNLMEFSESDKPNEAKELSKMTKTNDVKEEIINGSQHFLFQRPKKKHNLYGMYRYLNRSHETVSENNHVTNEVTDPAHDLDLETSIGLNSEDKDNASKWNDDNGTTRIDTGVSQSVVNDAPEPKHKIRISRVKKSTPTRNRELTKNCNKLLKHSTVSHKGNIKANFPVVKKLPRLEYSLNSHRLVQFVHEQLSPWQRARDRIKNNSADANGEDGYQNQSQVKIFPVPNVRSMINSKKLLYSKLKKWKPEDEED